MGAVGVAHPRAAHWACSVAGGAPPTKSMSRMFPDCERVSRTSSEGVAPFIARRHGGNTAQREEVGRGEWPECLALDLAGRAVVRFVPVAWKLERTFVRTLRIGPPHLYFFFFCFFCCTIITSTGGWVLLSCAILVTRRVSVSYSTRIDRARATVRVYSRCEFPPPSPCMHTCIRAHSTMHIRIRTYGTRTPSVNNTEGNTRIQTRRTRTVLVRMYMYTYTHA